MTTDDTTDGTDRETAETRELTVSRVIEASPDRLYKAFVNPDELAEWMHPHGFSAEVHHFEPEVGGSYRISMTGEAAGMQDHSHTYTGRFEELIPGTRIVQTESPDADEGGMTGEMTVTITFDEIPDGTEVTVRIEIPAEWPDEAIGGWAAALENVDRFLENI